MELIYGDSVTWATIDDGTSAGLQTGREIRWKSKARCARCAEARGPQPRSLTNSLNMSDPEATESLAFRHFLSSLDEESKYRYRERVAILVFDGGATRQEA